MKIFFSTTQVLLSVCFIACTNKNRQPQKTSHTPSSQQQHIHEVDVTAQDIPLHAEGTLSILSADGTKKATITYEQAETPAKRARGLMYRKSMNEFEGMFFIYENAAPRYMYMKNTHIPLDILFFDKDKKIIRIHRNTTPYSEELLPSIKNAQYALEVNAGFCARHEICDGDTFEMAQ